MTVTSNIEHTKLVLMNVHVFFVFLSSTFVKDNYRPESFKVWCHVSLPVPYTE